MSQLAIISGSTRAQSQSSKVAKFINHLLLKQLREEQIHLIDLAENTFPMWEENLSVQGTEWHIGWTQISAMVNAADGIVIVAPEWNGMIPPQLLNFFQLCAKRELAHKPALIVGVSSGPGGAYPVAQLRMSSSKNTQICYLPENVIIRDVTQVLNDVEKVNGVQDEYIRKRLEYALMLLLLYTENFKNIRNHNLVAATPFPFGM